MAWQCQLADDLPAREALRQEHGRLPIGTMWHDEYLYAPAGTLWKPDGFLSQQYYRDHAGKRHAIWVRLPDGGDFCVDSMYYNGKYDSEGNGWTVVGVAPNITVAPSINIVNQYHGWLIHGELSDDLEGRPCTYLTIS